MSAKKVYAYRVGPQHIDFRKKVSLTHLIDFILNAAVRNADENGFGLLKLQVQNYTWVLSRLAIDMHRFPQENEDIYIETWIQDVQSTFTTRNFCIRDGMKEVIGYAASSWAIIDMKTRKCLLLDTLPLLYNFIVDQPTPLGIPARIPNANGEVKNTFMVKYSDIDVNHHVNSIHYIRWISDCFPLNFYQCHTIKRFEINFLKELVFNDQGSVFVEMTHPKDYSFHIETKEKGVVCRARLIFKEK